LFVWGRCRVASLSAVAFGEVAVELRTRFVFCHTPRRSTNTFAYLDGQFVPAKRPSNSMNHPACIDVQL